MEKTDFLKRISKELIVNGDFQKVSEIELEALNYYNGEIKKSIDFSNLDDVPFIIGALDALSKGLRNTYPVAADYADNLLETIDSDFAVIYARKEVFDEILGGK